MMNRSTLQTITKSNPVLIHHCSICGGTILSYDGGKEWGHVKQDISHKEGPTQPCRSPDVFCHVDSM